MGAPMTFITRPRVPGPTGTEIGPPVSTAFIPRTIPSVGSIATQRALFSPRCCSISAIDVDGHPAPGAVVLDADGVVDGRDALLELDVEDWTDDLDDAPDVLCCHD